MSHERWVGSWATALVGRPQMPPLPGPPAPAPFMPNACPAPAAPATPPAVPPPGVTFAPPPFAHFTNQTLRQIVRTSVGGSRLRVVLSNAFGSAPLTIGAAHIALREKDEVIRAGQGRPLTFSGRSSVTIPANAIVYSDPVALTVPPLSDLAVDVYLPGTTNTPAPLTMHNSAFQTSYVSETGNHAGAAKLPTVATTRSWFLLSRVEVDAPDAAGVDRGIRRLDYRWRRVDSRHEQPVARRPRQAPARFGDAHEGWYSQRRHRRQSCPQRRHVRLRNQRARAFRGRRTRAIQA